MSPTASFVPNPIVPGFAPDPSITRIGDSYFLATSSFHLFPGIPIFASKDLASWEHIGNAINRQSQLSLVGSSTRLRATDEPSGQFLLATGGLYAPTIRHRDGVTYVICTNFIHDGREDYRLENFIVSTKDIWADDWSDAIYFDWFGIDPDLFWDDDGRAYIMGSAWKENPRAYISCMEIDTSTGATLSPEREVWDGFTKVIPEGPHLFKRDGFYYLLVSEGGTSEDHCLVMARSRSIWGPYESCERNPLLKPAPENASIQHTGHGDLFQDAEGQWWAACLGVRKSQGRYHMGRESFLTRAYWQAGEWPEIEPVALSIGSAGDLPAALAHNLTARTPLVDLVYIRDPDLASFKVADGGFDIDVRPSEFDLTEPERPISFIGKRQRRIQGSASVRLLTRSQEPVTAPKAGLALYKDEHRFARVYWDGAASAVKFELRNLAKSLESVKTFALTPPGVSLTFRLEYNSDALWWYFQRGHEDEVCAGTISTLDLTGYDFVGPVIGIFAVSSGKGHPALKFRDFEVDVPDGRG